MQSSSFPYIGLVNLLEQTQKNFCLYLVLI